MQRDILSNNQEALVPFLRKFNKDYYLAGGTAIAVQIGHRRSIDFDLFSSEPLSKKKINFELQKLNFKKKPLFTDQDQQDYLINGVKITFLHFPYFMEHNQQFRDVITMPSLLDLAAMKVLSIGRRSKWKDYVDLYFILKDYFTMQEIVEKAKHYFPDQITEKLFRNQLAFHEDIDYSEEVDYLVANPPFAEEVKEYLINVATTPF